MRPVRPKHDKTSLSRETAKPKKRKVGKKMFLVSEIETPSLYSQGRQTGVIGEDLIVYQALTLCQSCTHAHAHTLLPARPLGQIVRNWQDLISEMEKLERDSGAGSWAATCTQKSPLPLQDMLHTSVPGMYSMIKQPCPDSCAGE